MDAIWIQIRLDWMVFVGRAHGWIIVKDLDTFMTSFAMSKCVHLPIPRGPLHHIDIYTLYITFSEDLKQTGISQLVNIHQRIPSLKFQTSLLSCVHLIDLLKQ